MVTTVAAELFVESSSQDSNSGEDFDADKLCARSVESSSCSCAHAVLASLNRAQPTAIAIAKKAYFWLIRLLNGSGNAVDGLPN